MSDRLITPSEASTYTLSGLGLSVSIIDFKNWLDIVLIVLSIVNILIIIIFKFKKYMSDKKLDEDEKKDLLNEINQLEKEIDKLKDGDY